MKIAVVGGGINGVMSAWAFAQRGHEVDLYEKDQLMSATSRSSTKMLHGGLRYLEHGHLGLVREALQERSWWVEQAPHLARSFELFVPVYQNSERAKWVVGVGMKLYDLLSLGSDFPRSRWYSIDQVVERFPNLKGDQVLGAYGYWDAQMDDYQLGLWAANKAGDAGVVFYEKTPVLKVSASSGVVLTATSERIYDRTINIAGPWAEKLLVESGITSKYRLDLIRGSHVIIPGRLEQGCVLQVPREKRILFVLPYKQNTLLGTTEIRQADPECSAPSEEEIEYLITNYNRCFTVGIGRHDILEYFSGIRPIVARNTNFSAASRESVIERRGKLINVFGGKWTTSRALAESVVKISR